VALPLRARFFAALLNGNLKEWEITADMLSAEVNLDEGFGLHVWHVERFDGWRSDEWGSFGEFAWAQLGIGQGQWSALVVTEQGETMCRRLGARDGVYQGQVVVKGWGIVEMAEWDGVGEVVGWAKLLFSGVGNEGR
jgi:hypothetical protein